MADLHDTTEQYLLTVYELEEEGIPALRARLVERLHLSAPTVSETVRRLEEEGLVRVGRDRVVRLTASGRRIAVAVARRHRLAERFLHDVLGIPWDRVHTEACRWEHVISPEVEARLVELMDDPGTCPHGNPIPGSAHAPGPIPAVPLAEVTDGEVRILRLSEQLETDPDALRRLDEAGLRPDATVKVGTDDGELEVHGPGGPVRLDRRTAAGVFVELL